jgi:hypothetical protein
VSVLPAWKRAGRAGVDLALRPTAGRRVLPTYLVLGAQKAGTTSVAAWLEAHPSVLACRRKEAHYLDRHHDRGEAWYRTLFPTVAATRAIAARTGTWATGDATPAYLWHPAAPARAAGVVLDARLVALVREPAARAFSHWRHEQRAGRETRSFAAAVADELDGGVGPSYVDRGRYAAQLDRWRAVFPPGALLVVVSEELFADPAPGLARLVTHLGLGPHPRPGTLPKANEGGDFDTALPPEVAATVRAAVAADGERLAAILGRHLPW